MHAVSESTMCSRSVIDHFGMCSRKMQLRVLASVLAGYSVAAHSAPTSLASATLSLLQSASNRERRPLQTDEEEEEEGLEGAAFFPTPPLAPYMQSWPSAWRYAAAVAPEAAGVYGWPSGTDAGLGNPRESRSGRPAAYPLASPLHRVARPDTVVDPHDELAPVVSLYQHHAGSPAHPHSESGQASDFTEGRGDAASNSTRPLVRAKHKLMFPLAAIDLTVRRQTTLGASRHRDLAEDATINLSAARSQVAAADRPRASEEGEAATRSAVRPLHMLQTRMQDHVANASVLQKLHMKREQGQQNGTKRGEEGSLSERSSGSFAPWEALRMLMMVFGVTVSITLCFYRVTFEPRSGFKLPAQPAFTTFFRSRQASMRGSPSPTSGSRRCERASPARNNHRRVGASAERGVRAGWPLGAELPQRANSSLRSRTGGPVETYNRVPLMAPSASSSFADLGPRPGGAEIHGIMFTDDSDEDIDVPRPPMHW